MFWLRLLSECCSPGSLVELIYIVVMRGLDRFFFQQCLPAQNVVKLTGYEYMAKIGLVIHIVNKNYLHTFISSFIGPNIPREGWLRRYVASEWSDILWYHHCAVPKKDPNEQKPNEMVFWDTNSLFWVYGMMFIPLNPKVHWSYIKYIKSETEPRYILLPQPR